MRILITGATGQVGRHLATELLGAGHAVRALTRSPSTADLSKGIEVAAGDLTNTASLITALEGMDAVHLITFGGDDGEDLANGAEIVNLAERAGISRANVLGGWSSTSVDNALKASSISWTIIQPAEFMGNALELAPKYEPHAQSPCSPTIPAPSCMKLTSPVSLPQRSLRTGTQKRPTG